MPATKPPRKSATASGSGLTRTNIVLDRALVAKVKKISRASTTREAVQVALEHYARSQDYSRVLALFGSGGVAPGYDPKASSRSGS